MGHLLQSEGPGSSAGRSGEPQFRDVPNAALLLAVNPSNLTDTFIDDYGMITAGECESPGLTKGIQAQDVPIIDLSRPSLVSTHADPIIDDYGMIKTLKFDNLHLAKELEATRVTVPDFSQQLVILIPTDTTIDDNGLIKTTSGFETLGSASMDICNASDSDGEDDLGIGGGGAPLDIDEIPELIGGIGGSEKEKIDLVRFDGAQTEQKSSIHEMSLGRQKPRVEEEHNMMLNMVDIVNDGNKRLGIEDMEDGSKRTDIPTLQGEQLSTTEVKQLIISHQAPELQSTPTIPFSEPKKKRNRTRSRSKSKSKKQQDKQDSEVPVDTVDALIKGLEKQHPGREASRGRPRARSGPSSRRTVGHRDSAAFLQTLVEYQRMVIGDPPVPAETKLEELPETVTFSLDPPEELTGKTYHSDRPWRQIKPNTKLLIITLHDKRNLSAEAPPFTPVHFTHVNHTDQLDSPLVTPTVTKDNTKTIIDPSKLQVAIYNPSVGFSQTKKLYSDAARVKDSFSRYQKQLVYMRADRSPFAPKTVGEYNKVKAETARENLQFMVTKMERTRTAKKEKHPKVHFPSMNGRSYDDGRSTILCQRTIWSNERETNQHVKDREAPWPTVAEMKWEGEDRLRSGVGRYLPMPRHTFIDPRIVAHAYQYGGKMMWNGSGIVPFEERQIVEASELDAVRGQGNVPDESELYDRAEEVRDDEEAAVIGSGLLEAINE